MTLEYKDLFGFGAWGDDLIQTLSRQEQSHIPACFGYYTDTILPNGVHLVTHHSPHKWTESGTPFNYSTQPLQFCFDTESSGEIRFLIDGILDTIDLFKPATLTVCPLSDNNVYERPIRVHLVHRWIIPSIIPGEILSLKVTLLATQIHLRTPSSLDDQSARLHMPHGLLAFSDLAGPSCPPDKINDVSLTAKLVESHLIPAKSIEFPKNENQRPCSSEPMRLLICQTSFGTVSVLVRERLLSEKSRKLLSTPGTIVSATGPLIGDTKTREFETGSEWCLTQFYQLLRFCSYTASLRLISGSLRETSTISVDGEIKGTGIEQVITHLRPFFYAPDFVRYARVKIGKNAPCIALTFRAEKTNALEHIAIPIVRDNTSSISEISVLTNLHDICIEQETDCMEQLVHPESPAPRPKLSKAQEEKEAKKKALLSQYKVQGDIDAFLLQHDEDQSGLLWSLARNSDQLRSFVKKALTDGRILEETETVVEDKRIVMIQSGDAFGEQKIVGYLIKKPTDTSYVLVSFMPKLQGIFCNAQINGTCAWPNGAGGEVSLSLGQTTITATVPDFYTKKHLLEPGSFRNFRISAAVEELIINAPTEFTVSRGPLYEMSLEQFLKDNPEKTEADFHGVTVSTQGMQSLFPTGYSTVFELSSPVLACSTTTLLEHEIFQLKVVLHRFDDEEYDVYLYGSAPQIPAGLKVGDDIRATIRLYAELVEETVH